MCIYVKGQKIDLHIPEIMPEIRFPCISFGINGHPAAVIGAPQKMIDAEPKMTLKAVIPVNLHIRLLPKMFPNPAMFPKIRLPVREGGFFLPDSVP